MSLIHITDDVELHVTGLRYAAGECQVATDLDKHAIFPQTVPFIMCSHET
jgi:hypothetical protein